LQARGQIPWHFYRIEVSNGYEGMHNSLSS
jgi:hypothetical protein